MSQNDQPVHQPEQEEVHDEGDLELSPDRHNQQSIIDFQLAGSEQKRFEVELADPTDRNAEQSAERHEVTGDPQQHQDAQPEQAELPHQTEHIPSQWHNDHEIQEHHEPESPGSTRKDVKEESQQEREHEPPATHEISHKATIAHIHSSLPQLTHHHEIEVPITLKQSLAHDADNLKRLEEYLSRNEQAIHNILNNEFKAEQGIDQSSLFAVVVHILSIEPIDVTSSGDNILYDQGYGEPMLLELFSRFREEHGLAEDKPVDYDEIHSYLLYIVQSEHLQVSYTAKPHHKKPTVQSNITPARPTVQSNIGASLNLKEELKATRKRYEDLLAATEVTDPEKKLISEMIANIDIQLHSTVPKSSARQHQDQPVSQPSFIFSTTEALETVFDYYCKQSYATGKNATFDRIKHESNILTMNKFMMFCRDFVIIAGSSKHEHEQQAELVKMADLVEIFKKNSTNYKEMSLQQFNEALSKIAERMFPDTEPTASISSFQAYLGVNDEASFREQAKKLKIPYVFKDVKKLSKPLGYKIHIQPHHQKPNEAKGSARSVGKHTATAESDKRNPFEAGPSSENSGSVQNLLHGELKPIKLANIPKKDELSRPPMLPLPRKPNRLTLDNSQNKNRLSTKAMTPAPASSETPIIQPSNKQLLVPTATRYSEIHALKKRGLTIPLPSTAEDKKQFKLNNIVSDARNLVSEANNYKQTSFDRPLKQERYETREEKLTLNNLLDDGEEDEYLTKHWQMEKNLSQNDLNLKINEKLLQLKQDELTKERVTSIASSLTHNRPSNTKPTSLHTRANN